MYDPEFGMRVERGMKQAYASMENIKSLVPENHPFVGICEAFEDIFGILEELLDKYNNCFDEEEREEIKADINKIIKNTDRELEKFKKILDK